MDTKSNKLLKTNKKSPASVKRVKKPGAPPAGNPVGPAISCNPGASIGPAVLAKRKLVQRPGRQTDKREPASLIGHDAGEDDVSPGERFLWDPRLPCFGIRVHPSGVRSYVVQYRERGRTRRRVIGSVGDMERRTARRHARKLLSDVKVGLGVVDPFAPVAAPVTLSFAAYVERFWEAQALRWKPRTQASNRKVIDRLLIPEFGHVPLTDITRAMVLKWRDGLGERPGTANRSLPVLSVMMTTAETMGLRPKRSNPCRNVTRFPTKTVERFLDLAEVSRLGAVLHMVEEKHPHDCAMIRLLLLTGARKHEIESLQWSYLDGNFAHLPDSKTGPKTLYLGRAARDLLAALPRFHDDWVFPDKHGTGHSEIGWPRWTRIRAKAGLSDVRLHDLRHTFASHAAMNRVTLPTIGKLLGHALLETTERYAHLGDTSVREAAGRVSGHIARASGFTFEEAGR